MNNLEIDLLKFIKTNKKTEWGELVRYFMNEINQEIKDKPYYMKGEKKIKLDLVEEPYIAKKVAHLKKGNDYSKIYELKSLCYDSKMRGKGFSVCFWSNVKKV